MPGEKRDRGPNDESSRQLADLDEIVLLRDISVSAAFSSICSLSGAVAAGALRCVPRLDGR